MNTQAKDVPVFERLLAADAEHYLMKVGELLGRQEEKSKMSEGKRSLEDTMASSSDDDDDDHSRLSSLSDSTGDDLTSLGDEDSEDMERFERSLRQKHAKACKAMAVRITVVEASVHTTRPPNFPLI